MTDSLTKWDNEVATHLHGIRCDASWVKTHARGIAERVQLLPHKPNFPTEAEDAIEKCLADLADARDVLMEARDRFKKLPEMP